MLHSSPTSYAEKQDEQDYKARFPNVNPRKMMMKIDLRVIPPICILYLLAFLDRVNVANAALYGLNADLKLKGNEYNTALTIFFVPYVLFEIPSNLMMKRFRPHIWLPLCMFFFGMITCLQGTVKSYSGLLATRFFLGLCEANIFPGSFYLISMWYKRDEAQKRYTFFFSSTTMAGAFGGLLAYGIGKMNGIGGYKAWRWVFILEGLATCVASVMLFFAISDFPEEVTWLTAEEKAFVKQRLYDDVGDSNHNVKLTASTVFEILKDYRVILGGFMYMGLIVPGYSYAYFSPPVIQSLGHSALQTQLYSTPPWAVAFGLSMMVAIGSDWMKRRFIFYLMPIAFVLTGYIILIVAHPASTHLRYAACFLAVSGTFSAMPIVVCWFASNLGGHARRSVGTAWQIGFGNIGGFIATFSFLSKDAPTYRTGFSVCLGFICLSLLASVAYFFAIIIENRRRDRGEVKGVDFPEDEKLLMGDLNPNYRYML